MFETGQIKLLPVYKSVFEANIKIIIDRVNARQLFHLLWYVRTDR